MQVSKLLCPLTFVITAFAADPGIWKIAPPPPASWQRDRVADLSARRKALMDQIGDRAILILYAAEPRNYANDVDWPWLSFADRSEHPRDDAAACGSGF